MKTVDIKGIKITYDKNKIKIINSYRITKTKDMFIILGLFKIKTDYCSRRSMKSWLKEWKAHNRLYKLGLFRKHTKDCDLEENEKLHRLIAYQILGI